MAKKNRKRVRKVKEKRITGKMQRKLALMFALVLLALGVLNIRLISINASSGDKYTKKVLSQLGYQSTTIPYKRGSILDVNGEELAVSEKVYHVILDCSVLSGVNEKTRDEVQNATLTALASYFEDLDAEELRAYLEANPDDSYERILKNISYEEMQGFQELMDAEDSLITGVWFEETYIRTYPGNHLASAVLGFTLSGNVGNWGVEQYYDDVLNGTEGRTYGYLNSDSNVETVTQAAVDGNNVVLNLDANIQRIVEEKVTAFNETYRDGAEEGLGSKHTAVIISDPNTGAILAMCAYPYYDLNNPTDLTYVGAYTDAEVEAMTDEEKQTARNTMWRNFCISDTYEPGSTFKPFTVAMGLESGLLTGDESYYCDGSETIDGTTVKCSHTSGHGSITFDEAIAYSCNDALMQMSYAIGTLTFVKYQSVFGFGKKTGIDLIGEANAAGLLYTEENMTSLDLAVNSFGQNFNATMIQMMAGFNALVNGGYYYQPQVANRIEDTDGEVLEQFEPKLLKQVVSEETSVRIRQALKAAVEEGTALSLAIDGYSIGAKTGTAEKFPRGEGTYLVSTIAAVPAEDPELTIYVVIDEPNVSDQANSKLALDLCREILEEVLPYYGVTMDTSEDEADASDDGTDTSGTETDWSVTDSSEAWDDGDSFVEGELDNPDEDGASDYYETGDTTYTNDGEDYGDTYEGEYQYGEE